MWPMKQPPAYDVVETYFLEHRAKLLDIASFLDRIDRAAPTHDPKRDFRLTAFKQALAVLVDGQGTRTKRVLELLSDQTTDPLESAAGLKGAYGASPRAGER